MRTGSLCPGDASAAQAEHKPPMSPVPPRMQGSSQVLPGTCPRPRVFRTQRSGSCLFPFTAGFTHSDLLLYGDEAGARVWKRVVAGAASPTKDSEANRHGQKDVLSGWARERQPRRAEPLLGDGLSRARSAGQGGSRASVRQGGGAINTYLCVRSVTVCVVCASPGVCVVCVRVHTCVEGLPVRALCVLVLVFVCSCVSALCACAVCARAQICVCGVCAVRAMVCVCLCVVRACATAKCTWCCMCVCTMRFMRRLMHHVCFARVCT